MSNKLKRTELFKIGATAASKYRNGDDSLYFCPICKAGFTESQAKEGKEITLEHVPPKSIGGKAFIFF